ncbi:MAG: hypothetical protein KAW13_05160 [Dehalococcoidia bacterium]|nr:hypothetical protein [Dehalococcoidia bacterium]
MYYQDKGPAIHRQKQKSKMKLRFMEWEEETNRLIEAFESAADNDLRLQIAKDMLNQLRKVHDIYIDFT